MPPLRALLLSDRRPGHYHLAQGLLAAAQRMRPVEVRQIEVHRARWLPARVLGVLLELGVRPAHILRFAYGLDPLTLAPADIVVSAGGDTLPANVSAARLIGCKNIFYGSPRRFKPEDFSLLLTSYRLTKEWPRHAMTLKPSPLDPDELPRPQPGNLKTIGVLIGGPTRGVRFCANDWDRLFAFLCDLHAERGTRAMISNSRRTPQWVSDEIARRANDRASGIAKFVDVRVAGSDTLEQLFAESAVVLCTADSSSMVSEAIWLRKRAIALVPSHMTLSDNERSYRTHLESSGWCRAIAMGDLSQRSYDEAVAKLTPLKRNPLEILAELLREKLPDLFEEAAAPSKRSRASRAPR